MIPHVAIATGVNPGTIAVPTTFPYTTYPFVITRGATGIITTNFDITSIISAITNTWYVDPVNGNDGTGAVNNRALPLLSLATALAKNPCDQVRIINMTADFIGRTTKSWNNVQPAVSMSVVVEGQFRFISTKSASATLPTWTVNGTYANVYQTTIASASAGQVTDTKIKTQPSYVGNDGARYTLTNAPPLYSTYTNLTTVLDVSLTAGSWYHDGTNLYVRALDDRNLVGDAQLALSTTGNNGRFGAVTNALTLYVQGIDFVGGNAPFLALTALAGNTGTIAFNNCSFQGAQSSSNGMSIQGKFTFYSYRCGAYYNKADGFNYHSFEADGVTNGTSPTWVEIEGVAVGNGTTGSAGGSDNASTAHDFCQGIAINGTYINSDDRVAAYTNSAQQWLLGCTVGQAVKTGAGVESIATLLTSKTWIDSCVALNGVNPKWCAADTATLSYYNSGAVVNSSGSTGTVALYLPNMTPVASVGGALKTIDNASAGAPLSVLGGFKFDTTQSIVTINVASATAPLSVLGGLKYDANGYLVVVASGSLTAPVSRLGVLPLDANGSLVVSQAAIVSTQGGVGLDASGYVVTSSSAGGGSGSASLKFNQAANSQYFVLRSIGVN